MDKKAVFFENGTALTAVLPGDIDHHMAKPLREEIDKRMKECTAELLVLDFSSVGFMDSSGIGLIIGRCETADRYGMRVRVVGLSEGLLRIVRLCGIEKIKNLSIG